ncbi:MAG: hypothetical protein AB7L17_09235 [Ilumatobacteraceae bacterium]
MSDAPDREAPDRDHGVERAVRSIPLDTEDGGQVVIEQENVGPGNQVGGGEFKNVNRGRSPQEAESDQEELEDEAPIDRRD